jgi:hypothetical protein
MQKYLSLLVPIPLLPVVRGDGNEYDQTNSMSRGGMAPVVPSDREIGAAIPSGIGTISNIPIRTTSDTYRVLSNSYKGNVDDIHSYRGKLRPAYSPSEIPAWPQVEPSVGTLGIRGSFRSLWLNRQFLSRRLPLGPLVQVGQHFGRVHLQCITNFHHVDERQVALATLHPAQVAAIKLAKVREFFLPQRPHTPITAHRNHLGRHGSHAGSGHVRGICGGVQSLRQGQPRPQLQEHFACRPSAGCVAGKPGTVVTLRDMLLSGACHINAIDRPPVVVESLAVGRSGGGPHTPEAQRAPVAFVVALRYGRSTVQADRHHHDWRTL